MKDDQLRLLFTCCHPALAPNAQVALTLRLVAGLQTDEIARAFLVSETTTFKWFSVDPAGNIENHYVPDSKAETYRTATITIAPGGSTGPTLPAKFWVGLKNGDDNGLRVDLLAEVLVGGNVVSSRQVSEISAGGTGFGTTRTQSAAAPSLP